MRNLKKFLALVLAMMMAFSLMVTANAAKDVNAQDIYPDADQVTEQFVEAVDVLYGMGIMTGDNGNFKPGDGIMRSEMAAVMYRLMTGDTGNLKNDLYAAVAAERFADVNADDWFASYVGWCYDAGIMVGNNGYFRPWANVSGYETEVMVLRAMGYGKNGEYTGSGWYINASSQATTIGLLADVQNTNYSRHLSAATRRDVVASIVFQGAQLPTVRYEYGYYNPYIGVPSATTNNNINNPSLGKLNFGLTSARGIVVGNQATGENAVTKIGFSVNPRVGNTVNWGNLVNTAAYSYNSYMTYDADKAVWGGAATGTPDPRAASNVTLSFKWKTDLTLFNHAVRVWFDSRDASNIDTYALYDDVVKAQVVLSEVANGADLAGTVNSDTTLDSLAEAVLNAGFTRRTGNLTWWNYSFGPMADGNYDDDAAAANVNASPILENNSATKYPLYLVISNTSGNVVDVVIPLDMTFTQITQANNTTNPLSVGVTTANGSNQYFGVTADNGVVNAAAGTTTNYTSLAQANLVDESETALGKKVAAIAVTGTAGTNAAAISMKTTLAGAAGAKAPLTSTFYYKLQENKNLKTATVVKVDYATQDVTLQGGEVLEQSIFAYATDGTFTTNVEGAPTATTPLQAGRTYTFTLDEDNKYIYWETPAVTGNFVYGTYLDFETKTASSLFDYPLVYVSSDGAVRQTENITEIDTNVMNIANYSDNTMVKVNKREDRTDGYTSGYVAQKYVGYALNDGKLTSITNNLGTVDPNGTGFYQGAATDFGSTAINITPTDVVVGAKAITSGVAGVDLYLTENTQFYIVDGAGTGNQTVASFKGLKAIMEGMSGVTIDGNTALAAGDYLAADATPYDMFFYDINRFQYAQSYVGSAYEVTTLFLPADCVNRTAKVDSSMVFMGCNDSTLVNAIGTHATQYTVYRNGNAESVWIKGFISETGTSAAAVEAMGDNFFFNLIATDDKAADGNVIYNISALSSSAASGIIGKYFDGTLAAPTTTSVFPVGYTGAYKATTYNQQVADIDTVLYNVGTAGIKNLSTRTYPGILDNNLTSLNNAGSLVDNMTVTVSCILNGDDSTGRTVSFIYVNWLAGNPS